MMQFLSIPEGENYSVHYFYERLFEGLPSDVTRHRRLPEEQLALLASLYGDPPPRGYYVPSYDLIFIADSAGEPTLAHEVFHRVAHLTVRLPDGFTSEGCAALLELLYNTYTIMAERYGDRHTPFSYMPEMLELTALFLFSMDTSRCHPYTRYAIRGARTAAGHVLQSLDESFSPREVGAAMEELLRSASYSTV